MMWIIIMLVLFSAFGGSLYYLYKKMQSFSWMKKICGESKKKNRFIPIIIWLVLALILGLSLNYFNTIIVFLHIFLFWAIFDFIFFIIRKLSKKDISKDISGYVAFAVLIVYLAIGMYFAYHVDVTTYDMKTEKSSGDIKVVLFADSHICSTFDGEGLGTYIDKMNAEEPDVVLIAGDFVDDGTDRENMLEGCKQLSRLKTKYGVYFVYGNHDKGYYREESRGWSYKELEENLKANGVNVLEDETVLVDNRFYIVGRKDYSEIQRKGTRMEAAELTKDLDKSKYIIMMDHQPHDYDKEADAAADLVVSGHTHGGQLIPINYVGEWIGVNDNTYGYEKRKATDFLITSGISDWTIKFKTGCKSEYVVINISGR